MVSCVDAEPSDAILIRVVVALAGRDLLDGDRPSCFVRWAEGDLDFCGVERGLVDAIRSEVTFPETEMLSRATSVTAAALGPRGQDLACQLYLGGGSISCDSLSSERSMPEHSPPSCHDSVKLSGLWLAQRWSRCCRTAS